MKKVIRKICDFFKSIISLFKKEVIEVFEPIEPESKLRKLHDRPFIPNRSKHDSRKKSGFLQYVQNVRITVNGETKFIYQPHYFK